MRRHFGAIQAATAVAAFLMAASAGAQSARPPAAQMCITCHGANGISMTPDAPHLAGQPAIYLEAQLKAYRSGKRKHEVMEVLARPLSDEDISQMSAWFAAIKIEAKAP
jgi:cytochrome c553